MKKVFNSKVAIALVALLILGALSVSGMLHDVSATPVDRVDRVYGSNRSGTAVAISQEGWETSDYVVLARGDEFADALAGVPLAYSLDAPILLTHSAILTASTKQEIIELNAKNVIILGGKGAISKAVEDELISMGLTVDRISGANRNDTASQIALRMKAAGTYNGKIFVANGLDFPDAMAASAYAAKLGYPILLSLPDRIPVSTQTAIDELSPEAAYIAGGTAVISNAVMGNLPSPKRLSGPNRYATATALAEEFKPGNVKYYVATGFDFADAIAGGVLAAKNDAGLLLVSRIVPAPVIEYIADYPVYYATIFGGTGAVNTYIENELEILLDSAALAQAILAAQAAIDALPGQVAASADSAEAQGYIDAAQDLVDAVLEIDPDHDTSEWDAVIAEQQAIVDDMRAAEAVIAQIAALEPVDELTLDDKAAVEAARAAYNALTDDQKALVTNLAVLEAAEARIAQLEADLAAANAVIAQIAALEPVDELTLDDKAAVEAARAAYEALTDDQKALVTNLAVLEAAEARIAQLEADLAAAEAAVEAAEVAADALAKDGTDTQEDIDAAQALHNAAADLVNALPDGPAKDALLARLAQVQADIDAAQEAIEAENTWTIVPDPELPEFVSQFFITSLDSLPEATHYELFVGGTRIQEKRVAIDEWVASATIVFEPTVMRVLFFDSEFAALPFATAECLSDGSLVISHISPSATWTITPFFPGITSDFNIQTYDMPFATHYEFYVYDDENDVWLQIDERLPVTEPLRTADIILNPRTWIQVRLYGNATCVGPMFIGSPTMDDVDSGDIGFIYPYVD